MNVLTEKIGNIEIYDVEFRPIEFGEADHTELASFKNGHVYLDVDKDGQPLAITLITAANSKGNVMVRPNGPPPPPPPKDGNKRTDKEICEWLRYLLKHYPNAKLAECIEPCSSMVERLPDKQ